MEKANRTQLANRLILKQSNQGEMPIYNKDKIAIQKRKQGLISQ